jgi:hypothetical protein
MREPLCGVPDGLRSQSSHGAEGEDVGLVVARMKATVSNHIEQAAVVATIGRDRFFPPWVQPWLHAPAANENSRNPFPGGSATSRLWGVPTGSSTGAASQD